MGFEKGESYSGFRLREVREVKELKTLGMVFEHEKSGARLLSLSGDDDNKVFSVSFRTPPVDSTGMPHILEHSVLCGSRKFPSKEPFVELAKGSLKTFLNAFTFPDKTMYPVASRNRKDFFNLVDVYLDAVFHPNIYRFPGIFMQEGWHHELDSPEGEITYKGVVYNEMRGVYSTPESILFRAITDSLFPDSPYRFESGGDPDAIPALTLEGFLAFHRRYYHPSNSYFFLYGDGRVEELLEFIDREYLGDFDRAEIDSAIPPQGPFGDIRERKVEFPISEGEEERERAYLSLNFVTGTSADPVLYMAIDMLEHLLLDTPAAPLKNALLEARIGKDVFGLCERSLAQPTMSVVVKGSEEERKGRFREVVFETLGSLAAKGIDKKLVEASINIKEFSLREADYRGFPKGLVYCIKCMDSWLYDADPFLHLAYEPALERVKEAMKTDFFERLIARYFLENHHGSLVTATPAKGLSEKKNREIAKRLSDYKKKISEQELLGIARATGELKRRQTTPDTPEDLRAIPVLSLRDINPKAEDLPIEVKEERGVKVLRHAIFTNRIGYLNLHFDTTAVPREDIPYLPLLATLLGRVSTELHRYGDLSNEVNIHTGGIEFSAETFGHKDDDGEYYPTFLVRSKALTRKLPELSRLLAEIIGRTRFDERDRVREIVQETKSRLEMGIYDQGHLIAAGRLLSYFSPVGWYTETLSGLSFYKFVSGIEKNFDAAADGLLHKLREVASLVFNRRGLVVSVTAESGDYGNFREALPGILENLGERPASGGGAEGGGTSRGGYRHDLVSRNEGLLTPGNVQYVAKGFNFRSLGHGYSGVFQVLRSVISMDYLWNRVRVQGGAYGGFARFGRNGNMYFCSYRDPNLNETLKIYDEAESYIRSFSTDKREMTKYVIGTVSGLDAPLTPSMKGETATERHLSGLTREDVQKAREEVLGTTLSDIRECAQVVGDVMRQNRFCALGGEGKLRESGELFGELVQVF
jgi:Zn-dependent M16 (insulinase) family peptidase